MFDTCTRIREVSRCGILVLTLAILAWAAPLPVSEAQAASPWVQECIDSWNDAPASEYCSSVILDRIGSSTAGDGRGNCTVRGGCSITATVGEDAESTTWMSAIWSSRSVEVTARLDLCFGSDDGESYPVAALQG